MKVTVSPEGEVVFETEDLDQAYAMVKLLRNGHAVKDPKPAEKKKAPEPEPVESPLSPQLLETWEWLTTQEGVTKQEVERHFGLKEAATLYRLRALVSRGLAIRDGQQYLATRP